MTGPPLYAATVRDLGYDPAIGLPADPKPKPRKRPPKKGRTT